MFLVPMVLAVHEHEEPAAEHDSDVSEHGHTGILPPIVGVVALVLSALLIATKAIVPHAKSKWVLTGAILTLSLGAGIIHLLLIEDHLQRRSHGEFSSPLSAFYK